MNHFQSLASSLAVLSIENIPFGEIQQRQQQCFDYAVTTRYEGVLQSSFFTEGTRESQKKWSTAIRQLGFPSPASGRLCPLSPDRAAPRWLPPHG